MIRNLATIQGELARSARSRGMSPVDDLLGLLVDPVVLRSAWFQVRSSAGADTRGADGLSPRDLAGQPAEAAALLARLADDLAAGRHRPGPIREFRIPKPGRPDETRGVAILTIADRVVHAALKAVLDPLVDLRLGRRIYGYRPGRSARDQLAAVAGLVEREPDHHGAALLADVSACFDRLDHGLLRQDLRRLVADPGVLAILDRILDQVGASRRGWRRRPAGVLQGSPLSPLLANWALARFDQAWSARHGRAAPIFRYADDLAVLAPDAAAAMALRADLESCLLRTCRLELAAEKTAVREFAAGVPMLGLILRRAADPFDDRPRVRIHIDPRSIRDILEQVRLWGESLDPSRPPREPFARFNQRLLGWFETYQLAHDAAEAFAVIDEHVFLAIRDRFRRTGEAGPGDERPRVTRGASGHATWAADGVSIVTLAALPRRQARPTPPPSWRQRPPGSSTGEPADESP